MLSAWAVRCLPCEHWDAHVYPPLKMPSEVGDWEPGEKGRGETALLGTFYGYPCTPVTPEGFGITGSLGPAAGVDDIEAGCHAP
jgi:hypothetical protein